MPTPEEVLKAAKEQEQEAKRRAEHPVTDLRELNTNLDPEAEAEGKAKVDDVLLAPTLEETVEEEAPKKRTTRKDS